MKRLSAHPAAGAAGRVRSGASHGTDQLAQTHAYDFVRIETTRNGLKFLRGPMLRYLLSGVTPDQCYGWSAPIFAPFSGTVVVAKDGWPERRRLHLLRDLAVALKNALIFNPERTRDLGPLLGATTVVLAVPGKDMYDFSAHARCGSLRVREGEDVPMGKQIADWCPATGGLCCRTGCR